MFLTSIAGIATYEALQLSHTGAVAPQWALGVWLGAGGFVGSYLDARLQRHMPETSIRHLLGLIACIVAVRYLLHRRQTCTSGGRDRSLSEARFTPPPALGVPTTFINFQELRIAR